MRIALSQKDIVAFDAWAPHSQIVQQGIANVLWKR
jgi:hypothetical protein